MNEHQISKIKTLDPEQLDGSIQQVLLRSDLNQIQFSDACFHIAQCLKGDKMALMAENKKIVEILKRNNLYNSKELFDD